MACLDGTYALKEISLRGIPLSRDGKCGGRIKSTSSCFWPLADLFSVLSSLRAHTASSDPDPTSIPDPISTLLLPLSASMHFSSFPYCSTYTLYLYFPVLYFLAQHLYYCLLKHPNLRTETSLKSTSFPSTRY